MLRYLSLEQPAFGLDISDLSVKIANLKKKKRFFKLASFGEAPVAPGIIVEGDIKNKKALSKIVQNCLLNVKKSKIRTNNAIVSLPEEKSFLQIVQMPIMNKEELAEAIRYEAENYIPLPLDQVYLDFRTAKPFHNHINKLDVLMIAVQKKTIDSYLEVLRLAKIKPIAFEVEAQAVARALIKDHVSSERILVLDLGATRTDFAIFAGYDLRFTVSIPVCSRHLDKAIAKELSVDIKEAEAMKKKYGLNNKVRITIKNDVENKVIEKGRVFEAMIPALSDLTGQIKKYIDYYYDYASPDHLLSKKRNIQRVLLCGGGSNLSGLAEFLSQQLKTRVELGNPWVNILKNPSKGVPELPIKKSLRYATVLGLALRGAGGE